MMTARDPFVNVMRGALAAFSAGLGGADSVALLPFSRAHRPARRVRAPACAQHAIDRTARIASRLRRRSRRRRRRVRGADAGLMREGLGAVPGARGAPAACRGRCSSGEFQTAVARSRRRRCARDVARLKAPITGVSAHPDLGEARSRSRRRPRRQSNSPASRSRPPLAPLRARRAVRALCATRPKRCGERGRAVFLAAIGAPAAHARRVGFARESVRGRRHRGDRRSRRAERARRRPTRFARQRRALRLPVRLGRGLSRPRGGFRARAEGARARLILLAGRPADDARRRGAPRASTVSCLPAGRGRRPRACCAARGAPQSERARGAAPKDRRR